MNLGLLEPLGVMPGRPEFPIEDVDSHVARWALSQTGGRMSCSIPAPPGQQALAADRFAALAAEYETAAG
jgi:hypothetical protein